MKDITGFGCDNYSIAVYTANRPALAQYSSLAQLTALGHGEIAAIGRQCGNGWRKVFNVYAKLLYTLKPSSFELCTHATSWQLFRDQYLLQVKSQTALLFSAPVLDPEQPVVHIIMGRTYAKTLINTGQLEVPLTWLDQEFAINTSHRVIVCPYFDYRQLSNLKIARLGAMIDQLLHPIASQAQSSQRPSNAPAPKQCPQCQQANQCDIANGLSSCWCFTESLRDMKSTTELNSDSQCWCQTCFRQLPPLT
jgi:hypothetical protein